MPSVTNKDRAMDMEIQQVPWWNRRTRMERRFFILSIALLLSTIGLSIALAGVLVGIISPGKNDNTVKLDFVRSDSADASTLIQPKIVKDVELGGGKGVTRLIVQESLIQWHKSVVII